MLTVIAAILVFCLLILSHEFGHFIVAKACGVCVEDFSLGMGPKIAKWQGRETQYTLRLFPIGGWCKMLGEDESSENPRAFCQKPVWQRICIVAAGPVMNFLFAVALFIVIFMMIGTYSQSNVVGAPLADSPAEAVGIQSGDRILRINGQDIAAWSDIGAAVNSAEPGAVLTFELERGGETLSLDITPYYNEESGNWMIGVEPVRERQNVFTAISLGIRQSIDFVRLLVVSIIGMFQGTVPVDVAGPVGIVSIIGAQASYGLQNLLMLTAILSINLALINLVPLPALDGSRIVFLLIEGLRGRPINREREGMVHFIGLMLLMLLMVIITYNDIVRLITS